MVTCHGKDRHPNVGNDDVEEDGLASSPEISAFEYPNKKHFRLTNILM